MEIRIVRLADEPQKKEQAARWFHEKWGVPLEAYLQSMEESLAQSGPVPAWYLALEGGQIAGGLGVIENDFHERKGLAPNICAVYVEERAPEGHSRGAAGIRLRGYEGAGHFPALSAHRPHELLRALRLGVSLHGKGGAGRPGSGICASGVAGKGRFKVKGDG